MRRILCLLAAMALLLGCACAEELPAEKWQHEAGWVSFSLALSREELDGAWEAGAKLFGENLGLPLTGEQMKAMMLQGYQLENGVDELFVAGSRFTGKSQDGSELFDGEYALVETLEDKEILGGAKVHVFRAEKDAGEYTYLLMTEPVKTEGETAGYVTFNLFHTAGKNYREVFDIRGTGTARIPCAMTEKDTGTEGLAYAIERLCEAKVDLGK